MCSSYYYHNFDVSSSPGVFVISFIRRRPPFRRPSTLPTKSIFEKWSAHFINVAKRNTCSYNKMRRKLPKGLKSSF